MGKPWAPEQIDNLKGFMDAPNSSRYKSTTGRLRVRKIASRFPNRTRGAIVAQIHNLRYNSGSAGKHVKLNDFDVIAEKISGNIQQLRELYNTEHSKNSKVSEMMKQLLSA